MRILRILLPHFGLLVTGMALYLNSILNMEMVLERGMRGAITVVKFASGNSPRVIVWVGLAPSYPVPHMRVSKQGGGGIGCNGCPINQDTLTAHREIVAVFELQPFHPAPR